MTARFDHLRVNDRIEFRPARPAKPEWLPGRIVRITGQDSGVDPTISILDDDSEPYMRRASDVVFVSRPVPGPSPDGSAMAALEAALPAPEREILWQRQVTPHVALAVDDSCSIVLVTEDGRRRTISDVDALKGAAADCRAYITFRQAVAADWPDDPERVALTVESTFPMGD